MENRKRISGWKNMLKAKDLEDHQILRKTRRGNTIIWLDNWTTTSDLYTIIPNRREWDERNKKGRDLIKDGS